MGKEKSGFGRNLVMSFMAAVFLGTSLPNTADAAIAHRTIVDVFNQDDDQNKCVNVLAPREISEISGYSNSVDALLASAYSQFLSEIGQDPTALHAILYASEVTGVDFELMVVKAMIESQLGKYDKPIAVNGSARGVFQFMPTTWLTLFSWYGAEYNNGQYAELAEAIKFKRNGEPYVDDPDIKKKILDLRSDHYIASFMKATHLKKEEGPVLRAMLGREPKPVDYYMVHFLGIPRAETFYKHLKNNPNNKAAYVFKNEARYNRSIFYKGRTTRTYQEVYNLLGDIIDNRMKSFRDASAEIINSNDCVPLIYKSQTMPEPYRPDPDSQGQIINVKLDI